MIGNQERQRFNIESKAVKPVVDRLSQDKYGDILVEDANICPGLPKYKKYEQKKVDRTVKNQKRKSSAVIELPFQVNL